MKMPTAPPRTSRTRNRKELLQLLQQRGLLRSLRRKTRTLQGRALLEYARELHRRFAEPVTITSEPDSGFLKIADDLLTEHDELYRRLAK